MSKQQPKFVYLLYSGPLKAVKVGCSVEPKRRAQALRYEMKTEWRCYKKIEHARAYEIEQQVLRDLANFPRIRGRETIRVPKMMAWSALKRAVAVVEGRKPKRKGRRSRTEKIAVSMDRPTFRRIQALAIRAERTVPNCILRLLDHALEVGGARL